VTVNAYAATTSTTLSPGGTFSITQKSGANPFVSTFIAKNGDAVSQKQLSQSTSSGQILYILVNASGDAAPTIELAPAGVTW